jgi:hypothetical protein
LLAQKILSPLPIKATKYWKYLIVKRKVLTHNLSQSMHEALNVQTLYASFQMEKIKTYLLKFCSDIYKFNSTVWEIILIFKYFIFDSSSAVMYDRF